MKLNSKKIQTILNEPKKIASLANLIYSSEDSLKIKRTKKAAAFKYYINDVEIDSKPLINHIEGLKIPPAWQQVFINELPNGHLQAVGQDAKKRKQYKYHPQWSEISNKTKFMKMSAFGTTLPVLRKQVENDLELTKMTKRKCLALVIKLMDDTHIRIGNKYYKRKNQTYGLSTLRTKHLKKVNNTIRFEFVGKKGKEHNVPLQSKRLRKLVLECEEIPGWELFKYYDEDGKHHTIDSGMVNDYLQEICGELFTAKDFRTWGGTVTYFNYVMSKKIPKSQKKRKKRHLKALDKTAKALRNTRAVCKKYYVHPLLQEKYLNGTLKSQINKLENDLGNNHLSKTESVLLPILAQYTIDIDN